MSIWSTRLWLELPPRDQYGREGDELAAFMKEKPGFAIADTVVDVADSGMSSLIRIGIVDGNNTYNAYLSVDECRQLIGALQQSVNVAVDAW
jgi:hypothetical protein